MNQPNACIHVNWVPVTTVWSDLRLWMEEMASRHGR